MPNLLGTNPNQTPTVGDLGSMAFQDENAVNIGGGLVQADLTGNSWNQNTDISTVQPSLRLHFDKMFALDPRITFGRSGSPASYYDGKTFAVAEQNFWLYSQDADNAAWQKSNMAVAANAVMAPDGTMTADAIALGAAGTGASIGPVLLLPAGTFVMSIYAKAGTNTVFDFRYTAQGVASYGVTVDLGAGTIVNQVGSTSGETLTNVGGGWYRASFVFTLGSASIAGSSPYLRGNSASMSGSTMFIWGAQLEQRSAVSAYTPTTSAAITNYIPQLMTAAANQARFDFDPITGECKGLLVEEQRTNLFPYSEQLDNAAYSKYRSSIIANCMVAPDGTLTADKIVESTAAADTHGCGQAFTFTAAAYAFSVFLKKGERSWVLLASSMGSAYFDLANGVIGTVAIGAASMQPVGNGWYRCSIYGMASAGASLNYTTAATGNGGYIYNGDGCSGFYAWGAQLEAGSFATSYIPTTSGQVTRSADLASMTGLGFSGWYSGGEGTLYAETSTVVPVSSVNAAILALSSGGVNRMCLYHSGGGSKASPVAWAFLYNGAFAVEAYIGTATQNVLQKTAFAIKIGNYGAWKDGNSMLSSSAAQPVPVNQMSIGTDNGAASLNGWIKRLTYFPKRLTNAELVEMTV